MLGPTRSCARDTKGSAHISPDANGRWYGDCWGGAAPDGCYRIKKVLAVRRKGASWAREESQPTHTNREVIMLGIIIGIGCIILLLLIVAGGGL